MLLTAVNQDSNSHAALAGAKAKNAPQVHGNGNVLSTFSSTISQPSKAAVIHRDDWYGLGLFGRIPPNKSENSLFKKCLNITTVSSTALRET